jgi:hypothetical protein
MASNSSRTRTLEFSRPLESSAERACTRSNAGERGPSGALPRCTISKVIGLWLKGYTSLSGLAETSLTVLMVPPRVNDPRGVGLKTVGFPPN